MGKHAVKSDFRKAVFLDRDGVINRPVIREGKPYPPSGLSDFEIFPEVYDACNELKKAGYLLVVVTNQPDVGRGTLPLEIVEQQHTFLRQQLPLDRIEVCIHAGRGETDCECRKPKPGMILRAAADLNIDLAQSWMVGDRWRDVDCGRAAGCRTIFINRGYCEELRQLPDYRSANLKDASTIILKNPRPK